MYINLAKDNEDFIIKPNYSSLHSSMRFRLSWNNHHWDGQLRKHLTTLTTLPHCADWAVSDPLSHWTNNNIFNDRNSIPPSIISKVNNIDNIIRLHSSKSFFRWDYQWNFFRTLRYQNRFGPSFSNFNSFALKCANNILPTGDVLAKRHDMIYDNWTCTFCNRALETLHHLLICPSLSQQWSNVAMSLLTYAFC